VTGTDACTEHARQEQMSILSICISSYTLSICVKIVEKVPSKHAEHMRQELTRALSVRIRI
jgi:hypothetical protein